ncbi:MAG: DNA-directed RNA polymerase subunit H [Candidatus Hodarchaeota archaeon]
MLTDKQFDFVKRLIQRRGFTITKRVEGEKEGLVDIHAKSTDAKKKLTLLVRIVLDTPTIGVEILRNTIKEREAGEFSNAILIGGERYTYAARREAKELDVELLHRRFLSIDLFMHELVPTHEMLSEEEIVEIEKEYGIDREQLPKMKVGDPAAKAIGARPGDVLRIVRESETAGHHLMYRYCIS